MANYDDREDWIADLIAFYEGLTADYQELLKSVADHLGSIQSGLRFGVSRGPVLLGRLRGSTDHFTAIGADVNLAARLCSMAGVNGLVVSASVWRVLQLALKPSLAQEEIHENLKGFQQPVACVHIHIEKLTLLPFLQLFLQLVGPQANPGTTNGLEQELREPKARRGTPGSHFETMVLSPKQTARAFQIGRSSTERRDEAHEQQMKAG